MEEILRLVTKKKNSQTITEPVYQGDSDVEEDENVQLPPVVHFNQYRESLLSSHAAD